jgi:hypothetical protein
MAIATRPPETPFQAPAPASPARRWPKRLIVAVVVVLLIGTAGSFVWLQHYEPLVLGSGSYGLRPASDVVASFDAYSYYGDFTQRYVRWDVGRTIHLTFPIFNDGRLPITLEGALGDQAPKGGPVDVRIRAWGSVDEPRMTTPATSPITLGPGEAAQVLVDVKMIKPVDPASGSIISTVDLSYATFGVHHTVTMPMGQTLYLCGGQCPP